MGLSFEFYIQSTLFNENILRVERLFDLVDFAYIGVTCRAAKSLEFSVQKRERACVSACACNRGFIDRKNWQENTRIN